MGGFVLFFALVGPHCQGWVLGVSVWLSHGNCAWVEVLSQLGLGWISAGAGDEGWGLAGGSWVLARGAHRLHRSPNQPSPTRTCLGRGARRAERVQGVPGRGAGCRTGCWHIWGWDRETRRRICGLSLVGAGACAGSAQIHVSSPLLLDLLAWRGRLEQILAKPRRVPSVHVASVVIPSQQLLHIPDPGNER